MKKLMFLLGFTFCMFLSSATFAATGTSEVEATAITETIEMPTTFDATGFAAEDVLIICSSSGIDVYVNGVYVGTYDCVII